MHSGLNDKTALRELALQRRAGLTAERRAAAAMDMMALFLQDIRLPPQGTVAGYWPVRGEIDVRPLLERLRGRGHAIALPCVRDKAAPLVFRLWDGQEMPPVQGAFGIPEPAASAVAVIPDVLLVPLAAFDLRGHRLGYGAGFYDRTLQNLRKSGAATAIGVAYAEQGVDFLPVEETDIPMDVVVTDKTIIRFSAEKGRG